MDGQKCLHFLHLRRHFLISIEPSSYIEVSEPVSLPDWVCKMATTKMTTFLSEDAFRGEFIPWNGPAMVLRYPVTKSALAPCYASQNGCGVAVISFVCLPVCPPVSSFVHSFIRSFVCFFVCLSICLFVYLLSCPSVGLLFGLFGWLFLCFLGNLPVCFFCLS